MSLIQELVDFFLVIFKGNFRPFCMICTNLIDVPYFHELSISRGHQNLNFYYRHDDLKNMLDSTKDSLKLDAMKRIVGVSFHLYQGLTGLIAEFEHWISMCKSRSTTNVITISTFWCSSFQVIELRFFLRFFLFYSLVMQTRIGQKQYVYVFNLSSFLYGFVDS